MSNPAKKPLTVFGWGLFLPVLIVFVYLYPPAYLKFFNNRIYDLFLSRRIPVEAQALPVIIDLDEDTLSRFGQWPWPRYRLAMLLEKINRLGASAVAIDAIFAEPDRTAFGVMRREFARDLDFDLKLEGIPEHLINADEHLAEVLAAGYYVLATKFLFEGNAAAGNHCRLHPVNTAVLSGGGNSESDQDFFEASGAVCSLGILTQAVSASGFTNVRPDEDGIIRRIPLLIRYNDAFYPSLALAALLRGMDMHQIVLKTDPGQGQILVLGRLSIPLDKKGSLLVDFRSSNMGFERISGADIMDGKASEGMLKGRIAFLGTSAAGLEAYHATPVDAILPGVAIHAVVTDNLLKGDFLANPNWVRAMGLILIVAAGTLSAYLLSWSSAVRGAILMAGFALGASFSSAWLFERHGVFVTPVYVLVVLAANFSVLTLVKFIQREKELRAKDRQLILVQETTIESMATLAEYRDPETGGHIRRTQAYVNLLANALKKHPKFESYLDEDTLYLLSKSAPLHDIGKIGVRDDILLKESGFDDEEWEEMKKHTTMGYQAIQKTERQLGKNSFLQLAGEIAYTHQEKWNGSGYPQGLKGEEIPLSGRLMALADVYDALISRRVYKPPMTHTEAVGIIEQGRGIHFDPDVVDAFIELQEEFRQTALLHADGDEQREMLSKGYSQPDKAHP